MLLTPSSWARTERKDYEIKTIRVINLFIFFRVHLSVFRRHETFIMRFFSPRSSWIPLHSRSLFFYRTLCELARLRSDDEKKINISFQSALEIKQRFPLRVQPLNALISIWYNDQNWYNFFRGNGLSVRSTLHWLTSTLFNLSSRGMAKPRKPRTHNRQKIHTVLLFS